MGVEESEIVMEVFEGLAKSTQLNYKATLKQFVEFANSREGVSFSIDDLVALAKSDVKEIQSLIDLFYKWLQNEKIEGYRLRGKKMRESSANQRAYGYLRGFFVNVGIGFERKWKKKIPPIDRSSRATKKDEIYTFYDVDEEAGEIRFNREQMQQFLANLKLRDVTITLALLSSSQDTVDLFKLNVGDMREQKSRGRFFWEGNRVKTGVLFRTFFSKEATRLVRKYLEQEREGAGDDEPLFICDAYKQTKIKGKTVRELIGTKRMIGTNLGYVYRDAARRMGIKWEKGEQNPLRPKRLRHLFRTACDTVNMPELYTNAYMGHRNNQGQDYSEIPRAVLELQYLKVEPFITVYGEVEESLEIKEDIQRLESRIVDLNKEVEEHKRTIDELSQTLTQKVETIARHVFPELLKEDREAINELQEWKDNFTRRYREDSKQPSPQKLEKKKVSEKVSKIAEPKKEGETKLKPKKEKTWREEILGTE